MSVRSLTRVICLSVVPAIAGFCAIPSPVADAAMNQDKAEVRILLAQKADVNAPQPDGTTALTWAARANDLELVDMLLAAGANVRAANRDGATALYQASETGNAAIVERLLRAGADVNGTFLFTGETALMEAARAGSIEAVKMLLDHGADVNAKETLRGTTALMWAAVEGHADAIRVLIEHGADVNIQSKIEKATQYGTAGPAAKLPDGLQSGGLTPLLFAVREGAFASIQVLIDFKANANQTSGDGSSPLLMAVLNGRYDIARYLIDKGADVSLANKKGWTPLYLAIKHRTNETGTMPVPPNADHALDFIKLILDRGADVNTQLAYETEVHVANHVIWLKEEGATPFFRAAYGGDADVMKLLLAHGADPQISTKDHTTPLMAFAGVGFVLGLVQHRSHAEDMESLRLLLDTGADVNAANDQGLTPLMGAAQRGANEELVVLVEHGAKLDARDKGTYCGDAVRRTCSGRPMLALNFAKGVAVTVEAPVNRPETVALIKKMMTERRIPIPEEE
ncbi:MAG TPA: ankyrin repeat domain-containing protein [Bryobacteraceae bacterium]|nr:ankyrin repeat domain-containing protein [Bryobacteraceae bacterium]